MRFAAPFGALLLLLGLACGGAVVDTGLPFEVAVRTDRGSGGDLGDASLPPDPTRSRGTNNTPDAPPPDASPEDDAVADAEGGDESAGDEPPPEDDAVEPPEGEDGTQDGTLGGADTEDPADGGASDGEPITRPGGDDASEPDEAPANDGPTGPGQVLLQVSGGVLPFIDGKQMQFVAVEGGFLARRVSPGPHSLEVKNMVGNVVVTEQIDVPAGQRLKLRYARKSVERVGVVAIR